MNISAQSGRIRSDSFERFLVPMIFIAIVIILSIEIKSIGAESHREPQLNDCFTMTVLKDFNAGDIISKEEVVCGYGKHSTLSLDWETWEEGKVLFIRRTGNRVML